MNTYQMRQFIRLTLVMREIGIFDTFGAASHMRKFGVPLDVARNLLARRQS